MEMVIKEMSKGDMGPQGDQQVSNMGGFVIQPGDQGYRPEVANRYDHGCKTHHKLVYNPYN